MPIQVTKKDKETSQNLGRRFTKTVRQSGVLLQIRKNRFFKKAKSDLANKRSALRRVVVRAEKIKAEKLAKPK
jgi:ribosomal protein S21